MKNSIQKIGQLLELDDRQLYVDLASSSETITFGSSESDEDQLESLGKHLFAESLEKLRDQLCSDVRLVDFRKNEQKHSVDVILAVLDIVIAAGNGLPILTTTALILRYGLDKICNSDAR